VKLLTDREIGGVGDWGSVPGGDWGRLRENLRIFDRSHPTVPLRLIFGEHLIFAWGAFFGVAIALQMSNRS
jgi:hypothetical protein